MSTHRPARTCVAALAVAALALAAPLAACSSDDDEPDTSTEGTEAPAEATTDDTAMVDEMTDDTAAEDEGGEEASGELDTTGVLDFLNEEDAAIGALFDWNTGDGIISVNYLGAQTVGLYAVEIDEATATTACELASAYVFDIDEAAVIEVYTGGYDAATLVVSRTGVDGTCAAA